jgi:L-ribulose-5-phosphate 3-epimerase
MKLTSATTLCFRPCSLERALEGIAAAGFAAVELCAVKGFLEHLDPDDLGPRALDSARGALERAGVTATSLSGHSPLHTDEGRERHRRLLRACVELGIPVLNSAPIGLDSPDDLDAVVEPLRALGDEAGEAGVLLCLENDGAALPSGEVAARLLERVDHPAVRLNYDAANTVYFAGADALADVKHAVGFLGHVHLKDKRGGRDVVDFPPLGEGELDLPALARAIEAAGYNGPVCLEIEFDGNWPDWDGCVAAVVRSREYWGASVADGDL